MNIVEHMMLCLMCSGVGLIIGLVCSPNDGNELMKEAGIERIVRCNNSTSNWVEIVWKDGVKR